MDSCPRMFPGARVRGKRGSLLRIGCCVVPNMLIRRLPTLVSSSVPSRAILTSRLLFHAFRKPRVR